MSLFLWILSVTVLCAKALPNPFPPFVPRVINFDPFNFARPPGFNPFIPQNGGGVIAIGGNGGFISTGANGGGGGAVVTTGGNGGIVTTVGSGGVIITGGNGVFTSVGTSVASGGPGTQYHTFVVSSQKNGDKTHTHVFIDENGNKVHKEIIS